VLVSELTEVIIKLSAVGVAYLLPELLKER